MSQTDVTSVIYETQFEYHPKVKKWIYRFPEHWNQELGICELTARAVTVFMSLGFK
jgi:hypothetical protein